MKLDEKSYKWAIKHLINESDTDLFPYPKEIEIIKEMENDLVNILKDINLTNYKWNSSRRFIIPKSEFSYRVSTQLDPIDSIIFAAVIHQYGKLIENKRDKIINKRVFSYRLKTNSAGNLYGDDDAWKKFWENSLLKAEKYSHIVYLDIADFYNQIYHHTVENQLINCGFPNQVKKLLIELLEFLTEGVSRGVPIGPHPAHLIAEMTLIPIDESMILKGFDFCRYSDDIFIFCNSESEARIAIYEMAKILDKQQRLMIQKQKTEIILAAEFKERYESMIDDNPINDTEKEIIQILNKYSNGNPYNKIRLDRLSPEEKGKFSEQTLREIIEQYLTEEPANFSRLRWFYRRLIQVGTQNAIDVSIDKFESLIPVISDVCQYFISAVERNNLKTWHATGDRILELLNNELIKTNEYFQISLLSLFVNNNKLNHIDKLIALYHNVPEGLKRKIILACYEAGASTWIRELKEDEQRMEVWTKRALLIATSILPADEKKYYLNRISDKQINQDIMTNLIIKWAKKK